MKTTSLNKLTKNLTEAEEAGVDPKNVILLNHFKVVTSFEAQKNLKPIDEVKNYYLTVGKQGHKFLEEYKQHKKQAETFKKIAKNREIRYKANELMKYLNIAQENYKFVLAVNALASMIK